MFATTSIAENNELDRKLIMTFLKRFRLLRGVEVKLIYIPPEEVENFTQGYEQKLNEIVNNHNEILKSIRDFRIMTDSKKPADINK